MLGRQGGEKGVEGHSRERRSCHPIDLHSGHGFFLLVVGGFLVCWFCFFGVGFVFFFLRFNLSEKPWVSKN